MSNSAGKSRENECARYTNDHESVSDHFITLQKATLCVCSYVLLLIEVSRSKRNNSSNRNWFDAEVGPTFIMHLMLHVCKRNIANEVKSETRLYFC